MTAAVASRGRWEVTPFVAMIGAVLLLIAGVLMTLYTQAAYQAQRLNEVQVQAQVISESLAGALAFDDAAAAKQYLSALKRNPEVAAAGAYDEKGRLLASYSRSGEAALPAAAPAPGSVLEGRSFVTVAPVNQDSIRLGSVYLRTDTESFLRRAGRYVGIALMAVMASLLIGVLAIAQSTVRRANTQLKQQADDLREIATRQSAIFDAAFDAIVTLNPSGGIETINRAGERMFGRAAEEVLRRDISLLIDLGHEGGGGFLQRVGASPENLAEGLLREVTAWREDGTPFPVDLALSAMALPDGAHVVAVIRDITDRKKTEKLKQEFVSTVSHELRTPLTSIAGSLGLLSGAAGGELSATASRLLAIAHSNCQRLVRLINDILDIEKLESGKLRFELAPVDMRELVSSAAEGLRGYADGFGVGVEIAGESAALAVRGDADRLIQVVTNLLSNALKFSPRGEPVAVTLAREGHLARISITDHGPGIPEEFQARVFSKFAQADSTGTRQKGGTGLGLAISKEIVERHGGRLWFASTPGEGATFHIDLPLIEVLNAPVQASGGEWILVCEDDPDVASVLRQTLEQDGFQVDVATTLEAAATAIRLSDRYAALLLDLQLPDGDGVALIRDLREREETRDLPIIVISAYIDMSREAPHAHSLNVVDWMEKPVDVDRLRGAVSRALAGAEPTDGRAMILHVDDDHDILRVTATALGGLGRVVSVDGLAAARAVLRRERPTLAILDIGLADGSGLELLPDIDELGGEIPVVVFSAQQTDPALLQRVDEVLVKSRSSMTSLARAVRRLVRDPAPPNEQNRRRCHG